MQGDKLYHYAVIRLVPRIEREEFFNVVKGNGPCNKKRLRDRNKAHDNGAWVREAALAHAEKRRDRQRQAS